MLLSLGLAKALEMPPPVDRYNNIGAGFGIGFDVIVGIGVSDLGYAPSCQQVINHWCGYWYWCQYWYADLG